MVHKQVVDAVHVHNILLWSGCPTNIPPERSCYSRVHPRFWANTWSPPTYLEFLSKEMGVRLVRRLVTNLICLLMCYISTILSAECLVLTSRNPQSTKPALASLPLRLWIFYFAAIARSTIRITWSPLNEAYLQELLRRNWGACVRTSGAVSLERFQWRELETLVDMKAMLLARVRGKMADKVETA